MESPIGHRARDWDDAHLTNAAIDVHHEDPEFGYRFITDELARHGITASRNPVNRLCTQHRRVAGTQGGTAQPNRRADLRRGGRCSNGVHHLPR